MSIYETNQFICFNECFYNSHQLGEKRYTYVPLCSVEPTLLPTKSATELLDESPSVSPSLSRSPASIIDLYFQNTVQEIQAKRNDNGSLVAGFPSGSVQVIKTEGGSPVTAIQSDQYKIVSGHLNGDLRVHDMISGNALFHISGRPGRLKTLQFDDHRLISDGTLSVLVGHDFSVSFPQLSQDDIAVQMGRK
mmetsp:Transcript_21843/g.22020  ORF Transcript_21843/g.22020 Transcript_21843/m.22020 type:complete len:192 (+) Transcript_21843:250-825(+)